MNIIFLAAAKDGEEGDIAELVSCLLPETTFSPPYYLHLSIFGNS